jgi:serine/threonine protein kinase/Tfp pilus assembly protein PilF
MADFSTPSRSSDSDPTQEATRPATPGSAPRTDLPERIGAYRIVGVLGEGGMGTVYEAEQPSPRRRVAVKVVRGGRFVDEGLVRMFRREAESLARLKHPNIGGIYESGRTSDGQHFFAMELVRGASLDRWLAGRPRTIDPGELALRLRLFAALCDAVHYAHQRGVIHRDLKPSNIVVPEPPGASTSAAGRSAGIPLVKVLDFGLARIIDADMNSGSIMTEIGMIKGTLPYMSPEQARGEADAIDVRTDVYALGVILYELVSGRRPYDTSQSGLMKAVRVICEQPPRPLREGWAGTRKLDRDLETIVGKALEKEADRRYASAAALSEDVERYLAAQPILAHPPSTLYQLRKFSQRHRGVVAAAVAMLVVLIAGLAATSWGFRRASVEAARSQQIAGFMTDMLRGVGPEVAQGADTALLRSILDRTAERVDQELADQPEVAATLHDTIGTTYSNIGALDDAEEHLSAAYELTRAVHGDNAPETLVALRDLGVLRAAQARIDEAETLYRRALAGLERHAAAHAVELASVQHSLGILLFENGREDEAIALLEQALAVRRDARGNQADEVFETMTALGLALLRLERAEEAEPLLTGALEGRMAVQGPTHPRTIEATFNLAGLYDESARVDAAEELYLDALGRMEEIHGSAHPRTIKVRAVVGGFYRNRQRLDAADEHLGRAHEDARELLGPDDPVTLDAAARLAVLRRHQGRIDEAESMLRDALGPYERLYGATNPRTLTIQMSLMQVLTQQGRHDEAQELADRILATSREQWGDEHPMTLTHLTEAGHVYTAAGAYEQATELYGEAVAGRRRLLGPTHPHTLISLNSLAVMHMRRDDYLAALPLVEEALAGQRATLGPDHVDTIISLYNLGSAHRHLGHLAEAEEILREALERFERTLGEAHAYPRTARRALAKLLVAADREAEAEPLLQKSASLLLDDPRAPAHLKTAAVTALTEFYETWGRAERAAEWRARLP